MTEDQQDYIEQVFERARNLVQQNGVWSEITPQRLEAWLGCFENHQASLLAAYLLDNLCYRSRGQFAAMLDVLFEDARLPFDDADAPLIVDVLNKRLVNKAPTICLAPVLGPGSPPTKSGPYILRLAQRRFRMRPEWMAWPTHIAYSKELTDVIFVDDFCGTGQQFCEFAADIKLCERHQEFAHVRFWYFVATIHETALEVLSETLPFVGIRYAERLSKFNSVLEDDSFSRYQVPGFQALIMEQYKRIAKEAGLPQKGPFANGFGKLGLAYAYAHATPNNTLPIFWQDTDGWTPLLER
jgi:hypothetical protein